MNQFRSASDFFSSYRNFIDRDSRLTLSSTNVQAGDDVSSSHLSDLGNDSPAVARERECHSRSGNPSQSQRHGGLLCCQ